MYDASWIIGHSSPSTFPFHVEKKGTCIIDVIGISKVQRIIR